MKKFNKSKLIDEFYLVNGNELIIIGDIFKRIQGTESILFYSISEEHTFVEKRNHS